MPNLRDKIKDSEKFLGVLTFTMLNHVSFPEQNTYCHMFLKDEINFCVTGKTDFLTSLNVYPTPFS